MDATTVMGLAMMAVIVALGGAALLGRGVFQRGGGRIPTPAQQVHQQTAIPAPPSGAMAGPVSAVTDDSFPKLRLDHELLKQGVERDISDVKADVGHIRTEVAEIRTAINADDSQTHLKALTGEVKALTKIMQEKRSEVRRGDATLRGGE